MTNYDFLRKLFPQVPLSQIWVGWSDGKGGFPGGPADEYLDRLPLRAGHYFCIGSLKPGHSQRRRSDIEAIWAFVLDDIGSKCPIEKVPEILEVLGPPTWIVESSAGNFQYGWSYVEGVGAVDWPRHAAVVEECVRRWGVDRAGADPNRVVRLPSGFNLKEGKGEFGVRLREEVDGRVRVGVEDVLMAVGLDWSAIADGDEIGRGAISGATLSDRGDLWVDAILETGIALGENPNGSIEIICPWAAGPEGHTDARGGTAYLGGGDFKCHHAHCSARRNEDFKNWLDRERGFDLALLVDMTPPEEQRAEDEYVAGLRDERMFDPPPGGGGGGGSREGLTFQSEAEALDRLIYVQAEQVFLDEPTGAVMSKVEVEEALWKGVEVIKRGQKSVIHQLLTRSDLRKVHHQVYRPGLERFIEDEHQGDLPAVNAWQKPTLVAAPSGQWLKVILDHIENRLFVGDPLEAAIWLDWSAALVQRPAEKCNWMPIIVGAGGTGKDLLFRLYGRLVGVENLYIVGSTGMLDRATLADAVRHKLIMIEELLAGGRVDMDNVLKPLIAAPPNTITVRRNYVGPEVVAKVANLVAFTNNMDALHIGTDEERRRYWIYESRAAALIPDEGRQLAEAVEKGAGEFLAYLLHRDLTASGWSPYARPSTAASLAAGNRMMVAGMSGAAQKVLEIVEEGELAGRDLILSVELASVAANARINANIVAHATPEAMKKAGFAMWADRKQIRWTGGLRPRVWVKTASVPKDIHGWDVEKMRAAVEAEQKAAVGEQVKGLFDDSKVVPFKKD